VEFEFDANKSSSNLSKHAIDFIFAQSLWDDDSRLEIPALNFDEPRYRVPGLIGGKLWSAIITTYREDKIRIISVRRARRNEEELYHDR
jgi:uncharacterized DUF497 family protein